MFLTAFLVGLCFDVYKTSGFSFEKSECKLNFFVPLFSDKVIQLLYKSQSYIVGLKLMLASLFRLRNSFVFLG